MSVHCGMFVSTTGPAVTDDLFPVFELFHHRGGGLSLPVKLNKRKQLEERMDTQLVWSV